MWLYLLLFFGAILTYYLVKQHTYWRNKNVTQGPIVPIFGDNLHTVFRNESFFHMIIRIYQRFSNERYTGFYQMNNPMLLIRDPELLKMITVKDFEYFTDHMSFLPVHSDPLWNKNLLALKGDKWKEMRATISPVFTSSKMRAMFYLINECAEGLADYFEEESQKTQVVRDMKDVFTRYANDVIATCAFGIKCDSMKEPENEFYVMGRNVLNFDSLWKNFKMFTVILIPKIARFLDVTIFSRKSSEFFKSVISNNLRMREKQKIVRPDLIHLLMEARKGKLTHGGETQDQDAGFATVQESEIGMKEMKTKMDITDTDITAQALIFFTAGFETVSTLMTFMSYELAVNPDIQKKLQEEIDETRKKCNGKLTYDTLATMKYMDMVISETLRKWPPAVAMDRCCVKPYTIPAASPNESPVHLKLGDIIWLPIIGIHRDPEYYPEPEKFDPERFNDENKHKIKSFTYNPFGYGPRNCIGSRFALMETKTIFFHLLSKCELEVVQQTRIPLKIIKKAFTLDVEGGVSLGFKTRKQNK
ncbi:PREDICTED: cytochrome P450 9e2-like [Nicrophorus vespilloides]|uniref:Cytochrome P450 9e2-like n=1 Tax=Nicrophorus vespilloides TaxID=110193 RepID=A0ABM1N6Q5_NICVS|nr:PREDICTED: cytochrome P450 9e2-like [Nicrophorus vespilloides]XP_017782506.1 PREDICTED: cytochrome P450 9e2-like [Nicrophorus vespilloides]